MIYEGEIAGEVPGRSASIEEIGLLMAGGAARRRSAEPADTGCSGGAAG